MNRSISRALFPAAIAILAALPAAGQAGLTLPEASPRATVSQRVGLTDIEISYHRPAVNKRKVFGELVPWKEVWRAGANENTTIQFSSPVTVEGKALEAGTYGVHMLPTEADWTVAFSKQHLAWGSFSYDEKEDAARVTVHPRPAAFEERLSYRFDDPTETSVTAVLHWEKLEVPIAIQIDTKAVALASIRDQLRGLPRFGWQGWNQAAAYSLRAETGNVEEALGWADRSIGLNENFNNLRTKAGLIELKGDAKAAAALRARALQVAREPEYNLYGYQLLAEKKYDEAIAVFRKNVKDYPASWNAYDSLAEGYATKGDKKLAAEFYGKALSMAPEAQKKRIQDAITRLKA
ncbi:MAG: DUF2911 domain-containing protein [Acidobacteriota bacterium]